MGGRYLRARIAQDTAAGTGAAGDVGCARRGLKPGAVGFHIDEKGNEIGLEGEQGSAVDAPG